MKKVIWVIVLVALLAGISCFAFISQHKQNTVTDYGRVCAQENIAEKNCRSWDLFATTYILDKSTETVTWYDGSGDAQRINCHIADANNWWCDAYEGTALQGNGQNIIGFAGGKSIENDPAYPSASTEHFGFFKYWWLKII